MIASWIAKRMVQKGFDAMEQDDFDVGAMMKQWADDAVYDVGSELGTGETIKGKKAITEWFEGWKNEFPKSKFDVKNICFSAWPLMPSYVMTVQWRLAETDRQGREYKWDGVSVFHMKNFKAVRGSEHISMLGLPQLSDLTRPTGNA